MSAVFRTEDNQGGGLTQRAFLGRMATGLGTMAWWDLAQGKAAANSADSPWRTHPARAKRVIFLFQSGGPSHLDLYDEKPLLAKRQGEDLPPSVRMGQRLTAMTAGQDRFPTAASAFSFRSHGQSGTRMSDAIPHIGGMADELCLIRSLHTDAINHDPAITFFQTGFQLAGRPSMGAWLSYGLGSENENLPGYMVLVSRGTGRAAGQPLYDRLWGSGFLPTRHQGVSLRSVGDPVLYLSNPNGMSESARRRMLDQLAELNHERYQEVGDPEIQSRIAQYEMAYRMQTSVPELTDISDEPDSVLSSYGKDVKTPGTFAANCLLARRLAERGVRFTQVFIRQWDQHGNLPNDIRRQCGIIDQPCAALVNDLKSRGMLEDTLVIWGGEFGRTVYCQGKLTRENYGRDHHPRCYTKWMAGGGIKPGITYGETDDFSYNVTKDPLHIHDLNATILHCLGVDHERLTYPFQGRNFRLTDVHGKVVKDILA